MKLEKTMCALTLACALAACSTPAAKPDADANADATKEQAVSGFTVSGTVRALEGAALEGPAKVMVFWAVDGEDGDSVYKLGEGRIDADTFTVALAVEKPPSEALTSIESFSFGVGLIVVAPADVDLPNGKLTQEHFEMFPQSAMLGNAPRHALIYREGSTLDVERLRDRLTWPNAFPEGELSCGEGAKSDDPEAFFEIFVPTACDTLEIVIGSKEWINWT